MIAPTDAAEALSLRLAPGGGLHIERGGPFGAPVPPRAAARIERAFEAGPGHGLFHLGAVEVTGGLGPTLGYWREVSKLYLTKLRGMFDLEQAVAQGLRIPIEADEVARFLDAAPPMNGIEYLSSETVTGAWEALGGAFLEELEARGADPYTFLKEKNEVWDTVGRVYFHLAENKAERGAPFAFLATYTTRLSSEGKLQHVPLAKALEAHTTASNRGALLSMLHPVNEAARASPFLKDLVDSKRIFQPQAWTPEEAYRFLREVPALEEKGIRVRVPDWWNPRNRPRVQVSVTVGRAPAAGLGADAILDFSVDLALDGEPISESEWRQILAGAGGLALVKGRWVEVDRERLKEILGHWKAVERAKARSGVSFLDGMRLLARVPSRDVGRELEHVEGNDAAQWLSIRPGGWLEGVLQDLRSPAGMEAALPGAELKTTLRPYQAEGVRWLWFLHKLRLGGCLADDMGLGKTVQVIGLLLLLQREARSRTDRRPSLLVIPASLIGNWKSEIERFAPSLRFLIAHPSELEPGEGAAEVEARERDLVITTYGMLQRQPWLASMDWDLVALDEAQAIKNPGAAQTRAVKGLRSAHRLALTGTPVENRPGDLWSIFDFLNPGLLGGARQFDRWMAVAAKEHRDAYGQVRALVRPYLLRRLKTDRRIIADLPDKTEVKVFCGLVRTQAVLYQEAVDELARRLAAADGIRRRGIVLAFLVRLKQVCNHPSQWTGDGAYDEAHSGKMARLAELCEEIASRQEKVLVFTQFKELTEALARILERVFRRPGLILDGDTPVRKRRALVEEFQREDGPPFFVLSLRAGGTGLNLTAASHVIHFDRWWNPAVENQATDRAYRIGQRRNVLVHKFICRGTVEERIDGLLEEKRGMSDELLKDGAEAALTEMKNDEILKFVSLDANMALSDN